MDYPAAHSMDTTWFSVDEDGHVALFESGEAGAVPDAADRDGEEFWEILLRAGVPFDTRSYVAQPADRAIVEEDPVRESGEVWDVLMWAKTPRIAEMLVGGHVLNTTHGLFVFACGPFPRATLQALVDCGLVKRVWLDTQLSADRFGVFTYWHEDAYENWISGPYERGERPHEPLLASELPEAFANAMTLPVRFATTARLQPLEHVPCSSWQERWVDLDGNEHEV